MKLNNLPRADVNEVGVTGTDSFARPGNISIMHVTNGLGNGGAEGVLARLCLNDRVNSHLVVSLSGPGKYAEVLRDGGVSVAVLGIRGSWSFLRGLCRLISLGIRYRPRVIQSWMPHSDLLSSVLRLFIPSAKLVWSIRHSTYPKDSSKITTRMIVRFLALISSFAPSQIVSCSEAGVQAHMEFGYEASKFLVIPNGADLSYFQPRNWSAVNPRPPAKTPEVRFAMLGRYHPQKDHITFLKAIQIARRNISGFTVKIAGIEPASARVLLTQSCSFLGIADVVSILGEVKNPAGFLGEHDFLVSSSSSGEGFPNVIIEAMASEVIPISTDVGDAKAIIGDTGRVVPPRSPDALADALRWATVLSNGERVEMARAARRRVGEVFSQERMISSYQDLYASLQA